MRSELLKALFELAEHDSDVILLTADLGFGVFEEYVSLFPKQYLNVGVAEQNMMGIACGLALEGKTVFTYSIGNFPTLRCLEQIRNDACYHELNVNIISSGGGFSYGGLGMSHHTTEDLAILRALPGTTVVAPCTAWEAGQAVRQIVNVRGVGYLRIDKSAAPEHANPGVFQIGRARRLQEGTDITIVVTGGIAQEAMIAAQNLEKIGITCRVVSMHTVKPIDAREIERACVETGGIMTLEEHTIVGGLGGAVAEVCMEQGFVPKIFMRFGLQDEYPTVVGSQGFLRGVHRISALFIEAAIINACRRS